MIRTRFVLAFTLTLSLVVGCGASSKAAGSTCAPVNNWGMVFACGGGGGEQASDPLAADLIAEEPADDSSKAGQDDAADETAGDAVAEPDAPAFLDGDSIALKSAIEFEDGKAALTAESKTTLRAVAQILVDNPDIRSLRVTVRPEKKGKRHRKLAKKRAKVVRKYLIKQGAPGKKVKVKAVKKPGDGIVEFAVKQ